MKPLLQITMKRLVNALILCTGLGCKADSSDNMDMVYGFDNVSLALCQTSPSKNLKLSN